MELESLFLYSKQPLSGHYPELVYHIDIHFNVVKKFTSKLLSSHVYYSMPKPSHSSLI
jgi:hypothetical protein